MGFPFLPADPDHVGLPLGSYSKKRSDEIILPLDLQKTVMCRKDKDKEGKGTIKPTYRSNSEYLENLPGHYYFRRFSQFQMSRWKGKQVSKPAIIPAMPSMVRKTSV